MKVTNKLTMDLIEMYINIPTDEGSEYYMVDIDRPDMDEDVYCIGIHDLDGDKRDVYSRFEINSLYEVTNDRELDEREDLILLFIANRLRLD